MTQHTSDLGGVETTDINLGQRIAALRELAGQNQQQIAEMLGIPRSAVSAMENGNRRATVQECIRITQHFGVSLTDLFNMNEIIASRHVYALATDTPYECGVNSSYPDHVYLEICPKGQRNPSRVYIEPDQAEALAAVLIRLAKTAREEATNAQA